MSSKNSYYINNNIGNIQSKNKRFNEPDTIDNMTNNSLTDIRTEVIAFCEEFAQKIF